jgi:hypothetical protein
MTADLVAGTALIPVAVLSLREVRHRRELPFALLPALFAAHQFLEVAVWAGLDGDVPAGIANLAMRAYLFIAWPLLPLYMPLAVLMLEPRRARRRVAPFVALGAIVSAYLAFVVLANPVEVIRHALSLGRRLWSTQPRGARDGRCFLHQGIRVAVVCLRRRLLGTDARAHDPATPAAGCRSFAR